MKATVTIFLSVLFALVSLRADVPANNKYSLSRGYKVTINGTSNLHPWDERVEMVKGSSTIDWNANGTCNVTAMSIAMSVLSIKSNEGAVMNNNTYKALKSDKYPEITLVLDAPLLAVPAGVNTVSARISLSIAGVTRPVDMMITVTSTALGNVAFEGSKVIKMTDFGVTPPKAMMGMLKTGNEITIHFKTSFAANKQ